MNKILMVPACEIAPKDKIRNTETESRCVSALIKWQNGRYAKLLLCGGIFLPPDTQTRPAADLMAEWFKREGVSAKDILIDDLSRDSFENVFFGLKKLEDHNFSPEETEIRIISSRQHSLRIYLTLTWGYKYPKVKREKTLIPVLPGTFLKECFFLLYHLYDKKGIKWLAQRNRRKRYTWFKSTA